MAAADDSCLVPPSLLVGDLPEFWGSVARRLERNGVAWRGRVGIAELSADARMVLRSLGGDPRRTTVDLDSLEAALANLGVGSDLVSALASLGQPVSPEPAQRRATRGLLAEGRAAARAAAAEWPEPWSGEWIDGTIKAGLLTGLGPREATAAVTAVRRVLDAIDQTTAARAADGAIGALGGTTADSRVQMSRVDLAAIVLGSAHALDDGTLLERCTARALSYRNSGPASSGSRAIDDAAESAPGRAGTRADIDDPWRQAGVERNLLAGAAVTWRLPLDPAHPLADAIATSTSLGLPYVITRLALEKTGIDVVDGAEVLVVENPRVLEYAAQTGSPHPMVCANGNPSATVVELLEQLMAAGASLTYHGDFDTAGLAICRRMAHLGLIPWRMDTDDYRAALRSADADGVDLLVEGSAPGPTPWDPDLQVAFDVDRRIIHEERLLHHIVPTGQRSPAPHRPTNG